MAGWSTRSGRWTENPFTLVRLQLQPFGKVLKFGSRGRPAKALDRVIDARVQIPSFPYYTKEYIVNKEDKLALLKMRYNKLMMNGKNVKCPGILRKIARQIRTLENS